MPRRKQDRPKRMKWEENEKLNQSVGSSDGGHINSQSASGSEADEESDENQNQECENYDSILEKACSPLRTDTLHQDTDKNSTVCQSGSRTAHSNESDEGNMVSLGTTESPDTPTPLDFSVKKYNVLDLTAKCEELVNHVTNDSSPLDLSVPRLKRPSVDYYSDDIKKLRKLSAHVPAVPKSPWGYSMMNKSVGRIDSYWDAKESHNNYTESHRKPLADGQFVPNKPNVWQSQWLNKGGDDINKDVLKCVWCKESFSSLSDLTLHLKNSPRCGVSVPRDISPVTSSAQNMHKPPSSTTTGGSSSLNDLNMLIKETMPLPRKLVRGQDVWLGKGAEQTKQILKCMWCGQSFRSLADMTTHMRQTQHYTNIISQEQLISWKSPEEKTTENVVSGNGSSAVNAVLTCKVCDQAFSSLKELSTHMSKNAHYQEHLFKAISEGGTRRRPVREKRKKALPVKKLLEMERSHKKSPSDNDSTYSNSRSNSSLAFPRPDSRNGGRIACEKCSNKIDSSMFVEHIRNCIGKLGEHNKNKANDETTTGSDASAPHSPVVKMERESPTIPLDGRGNNYDDAQRDNKKDSGTKSPSVLNAIERLIEKSFDSNSKKPNVTSAFILKKMGFDENAFQPISKSPTKNASIRSSVSPNDNFSRPSSRDSPSCFSGEDMLVQRLKPRVRHSSSDLSDNSLVNRNVSDLSKDRKSSDKLRCRRRRRKRDKLAPKPKLSRGENEVKENAEGAIVNRQPSSSPSSILDRSPANVTNPVNDVHKAENDSFNDDKAKCDRGSESGSVLSEDNVDNECDNRSDGALSADDEHFLSESDDRPSPSILNKTRKFKTKKRLAKTIRDRHRHNGNDNHHPSIVSGASADTPPSSTQRDSTPSPPTPVVSRGQHGSDHPLMQLQKLLDKTDAQLFSKRGYNNKMVASFGGIPPNAVPTSHPPATSSPFMGSFGWAYNDALAYDSINKTPFGDIGFGGFTPPQNLSSPSSGSNVIRLEQLNGAAKTESPEKPPKYGVNNNSSTTNNNIPQSKTNGTKEESGSRNAYDESPHSKFLKYSELAKQLSSK